MVAVILGLVAIVGVIHRIDGRDRPHTGILVASAVIAVLLTGLTALCFGGERATGATRLHDALLTAGVVLGSFAAIAMTVSVVVAIVDRIEGRPKPSTGVAIVLAVIDIPLVYLPALCLRALRARWSAQPPP